MRALILTVLIAVATLSACHTARESRKSASTDFMGASISSEHRTALTLDSLFKRADIRFDTLVFTLTQTSKSDSVEKHLTGRLVNGRMAMTRRNSHLRIDSVHAVDSSSVRLFENAGSSVNSSASGLFDPRVAGAIAACFGILLLVGLYFRLKS